MGFLGSGVKSLTGVDLFKASKSEVSFVESARSKKAGEELLKRGLESVTVPGRMIDDLTDIELRIEQQARDQVFGGPSETTQRGIDLTAAAAEQTDPLEDPTIKALIAEATRIGQEETGRVGRAVQISGNLGSTTGRDVLGRSVGATQERIIAAASPLISQKLGITERARLDITGLTERLETQRASFGGAVSNLRRGITESKSAAQIEKFITDLNIRFGLQANLLSGQTNRETLITGGDPSLLTQAAPLIGAAAVAASDRRIKENIVPIDNALEKLMQLEGFTFTMKEGGEKKAGILAQDLEKVLPDAVFEIDGVKHIKLDAVLGLIISAIKEMN